MKAERRHQLQANSLAHVMENLPEYGKRYGSHILLAVTIVLLIAVVIRWRVNTSEENLRTAAFSLDTARTQIEEVKLAPLRGPIGKDASFYSKAKADAASAEAAITEVFNTSDDPRNVAQARLLRGDLNWALANLPVTPSGDEKDRLPKTPEQYLAAAGEAYDSVIHDPKSPHDLVVTAHLDLAAVNENQQRWDDAKRQYEAIENDSLAEEPFKDRARNQIERLDKIRVAPLLATAPAFDAADSQLPADISGPPKPSTTGPAATTTTAPSTAPSATVEPPKPSAAKPASSDLPKPAAPDATKPPASETPKPDAPSPK